MTLPSTVAFRNPFESLTHPPTLGAWAGPRMLRNRLYRTTQSAAVCTDMPWV